ncbi:MAG: hypothetical protein OIF47_12550 [Marinibacterium sp.]|nr:hypothetical protein [Marinibacterium sp.]
MRRAEMSGITGPEMTLNRPFRTASLMLAGSVLLALAGCISVPELDRAVPEDVERAPYPEPMPLDPAVFAPRPPGPDRDALNAELLARREAAEARAAALDAPSIDDETRARMLDALAE